MHSDIDRPALKDILWHKMRDDLVRFIPALRDTDLLMCPACCRFLQFKDFSVEHIIPKQALKDDPDSVKAAFKSNERSGNILLCNKTLKINGRKVHDIGCNSWKGKYYDPYAREVLNRDAYRNNGRNSGQHTTSIFAIGFLALVYKFGFQPALTKSGLLMRKQFFHPQGFISEMPLKCQTLLMTNDIPPTDGNLNLWSDPFRFRVDGDFCLFFVRGICTYLPLSRDPHTPVAMSLPFVPKRHSFKPSFYTVFD